MQHTIEFKAFPSISRLSRDIVITEKLDGTNASIVIMENGEFLTGSRNRWITPEDDNYGFSRWAHKHKDELLQLGVGAHFGEWWGQGIQIGYGLKEKRFSLFNVGRWNAENIPACVGVVPILYTGVFDTAAIDGALLNLKQHGSVAAQGFMRPEGIVIYHKHSNALFKKTILNDDKGKGYGS
jgi:hypothetical protein